MNRLENLLGSCTEGEGYEGDEVTILKQQMKEVLYRISIMETELRSIKNTKQTQEDEEPHYNGQHSGPPIACTDNGDEEEPVFGDHPLNSGSPSLHATKRKINKSSSGNVNTQQSSNGVKSGESSDGSLENEITTTDLMMFIP